MLSPTSATSHVHSSQEICRAAAATYESLFARLSEIDPDAGFGPAYASGARAIDVRARAADWRPSDSTVRAVEGLLHAAESVTEDEVAEWIFAFPRRLLQTMDRRSERDGDPATGRRAGDQRARAWSSRRRT